MAEGDGSNGSLQTLLQLEISENLRPDDGKGEWDGESTDSLQRMWLEREVALCRLLKKMGKEISVWERSRESGDPGVVGEDRIFGREKV
ncbi:hypothetical protein COLO4_09018 [Corchorus olitorius]|uniref:Uncharacterized protein n=1 Tax=Corchorus olitorius TaxID=93759 RepID=A0A1R3KDJ3_9ROSI|nr:hypothetical protein COLO4_09018 [Corchorus olitorius]